MCRWSRDGISFNNLSLSMCIWSALEIQFSCKNACTFHICTTSSVWHCELGHSFDNYFWFWKFRTFIGLFPFFVGGRIPSSAKCFGTQVKPEEGSLTLYIIVSLEIVLAVPSCLASGVVTMKYQSHNLNAGCIEWKQLVWFHQHKK